MKNFLWKGFFGLASLLVLAQATRADVSVNVQGPAGARQQQIAGEGGTFNVDLPLARNSVNKITVSASDSSGNQASREISVTQVSFQSLVVAQVVATPLSVERVEQLVNEGVIKLDDPQNYNVSQFNIVLTIGQESVPISVPVAVPINEPAASGTEVYKMPDADGAGSGATQDLQIIVFDQVIEAVPGEPEPPSIPGVIVIEGKIKSLKEFFSVRLLLMNTSGIFTLSDVVASLEFPNGGLSNVLPADGIASLGEILPGSGTEPGQKDKEFIVRGDATGEQGVKVLFAGKVTGPGIDEGKGIPFSGSASTSVTVKGPPTFTVQVSHPETVTKDVPYQLTVDITNTGETPALYASLDLDLGGAAKLVDCSVDATGTPTCTDVEGIVTRSFGHIYPGQTVKEVYDVTPKLSGSVTSCLGISDQNIDLQVTVGASGCLTGTYPPGYKAADGVPTVAVLPAPNMLGVNTDSPVTLFFSEKMNEATITSGEGGSFRVLNEAGEVQPGVLHFETIAEKTVAIWQYRDGTTSHFAENAKYTVSLSTDIRDLSGYGIASAWLSSFTTTASDSDDVTAPTITLGVEAPVNPNSVQPGQLVKLTAYAADQGTGVMRVELRMKDLSLDGSTYKLFDQKTLTASDLPPYGFVVDSAKLLVGHTYQLMATAYDKVGNSQSTTLSLVMAAAPVLPSIALSDDTTIEVQKGYNLTVVPTSVGGGVNEVRYYLDGQATPIGTQSLPPYSIALGSLDLTEGAHQLRAVAVDALNQTAEDVLSFKVLANTTAPIVSFTSPAASAQIKRGASMLVAATATDTVGVKNVAYYLDSSSGASFIENTSSFLVDTQNLSLGTHRFYVIATNNLNVSNEPTASGAVREFIVIDPAPAPAPAAPTVTKAQLNSSGEVEIQGSTIANGRVDISNTNYGTSLTVYGDTTGAFSAKIAAQAGDVIKLVAYDLSQTNKSAARELTVGALPKVTSIEVDPTLVSFDQLSQTRSIYVFANYDTGTRVDVTASAQFGSSSSTVATVTAQGLVRAVGNGTANVVVTFAEKQLLVPVTVNAIFATSIEITPAEVNLDSIGAEQQLSVQKVFNDGHKETLTSGVLYTTGDPKVATVTSGGLVKAVAGGQTQITAYVAGLPACVALAKANFSSDTKPEVQILAPVDSSSVERGDIVSVSVKATDAVGGVNKVVLSVTGAVTYSETRLVSDLLSTVQEFSFSVSETASLGGEISITAYAEDTGTQTSALSKIKLYVADTVAPTVSIVQPVAGSGVHYGDTVTVQVDAADAYGVSEIGYQLSGEIVAGGKETFTPVPGSRSASFTFNVPYDVTSPNFTVTAYAKDSSGNQREAISSEVLVLDADTTAPQTVATAASAPQTGTKSTISYEVTSGVSDLDHVELFFRRNGVGTFNRYTNALAGAAEGKFVPQSGASGTIEFDSTQMGGDGSYEFYTVGVDKAGNREAAPIDIATSEVTPDQSAQFNSGALVTVISTATTITANDYSYDDQNLKVVGVTLVVSGTHSFKNVELLNGAVLTHVAATPDSASGMDLTLWSLSVDGASEINVNGRGYLGGKQSGISCTGRTVGNVDGATYRSGASYGGPGAVVDGVSNVVYGSLIDPSDLGSGGSCGWADLLGGNGGGMVKISAVNVALDGKISANGNNGNGYNAGSGSGGTVNIRSNSLSGEGAIQAKGGAGEVGGSGGRVAIRTIDRSTYDQTKISALGGSDSIAAGNGTVYLSGLSDVARTLVIDGQSSTSTYTPLTIPSGYVFDSVVIRNHARVTIGTEPLVVAGELRLENDSILSHPNVYTDGLRIQVEKLVVDSTSAIDVSSRGYRGGRRDGISCTGETIPGATGATYRAGASYGGWGVIVSGEGPTNPIYGDFRNPYELGSGGSCGWADLVGGNGGGSVTINASKLVAVYGAIRADGGAGNGYNAGSGSGGSIKITAPTVRGTGVISAAGGAGEVGAGGGRIAIYCSVLGVGGEDFAELKNITAIGGRAGSVGSAGTIFVKRLGSVDGDLYIDEKLSGSTVPTATSLVELGFGTITAISANTVTVSGIKTLYPDKLVGMKLNPNLAQSKTFTILSNTADTITVAADGGLSVGDVADVGDPISAVYQLDNLYLKNGANLLIGDRVEVSGRFVVGDKCNLSHPRSTLATVSRLDLQAGSFEVASSGTVSVDGAGYLGGKVEGNDCTAQTVGNIDGAAYRAAGSHAGRGAVVDGTGSNPVYGEASFPVELGSGGSCGWSDLAGGSGGGLVRLVAQSVVVDGLISANGVAGSGYQAGSGSGGSINITTGSLGGAGKIRANGGIGEVGGGAGRIAVRFSTLAFLQSQFEVLGGQSSSWGGNGTLFLMGPDAQYGDLVVSGSQTTPTGNNIELIGNLHYDNVVIQNGVNAITSLPIKVEKNIELKSGSVLTHPIGFEAGLVLEASKVIVDATSSIDVSGKGYRGGKGDGNANCQGITFGGQLGAEYRASGSYGGYGAIYDNAGNNYTYGDPKNPELLGSGGSCGWTDLRGGNGGGRIAITASDEIDVDGSVRADGISGLGYIAGSGSGGSIKIIAGTVKGTGVISSSGGAGEIGGGGGRIAIFYDQFGASGDDLSGLRNIQAYGGKPGSGYLASAGSVYLKQNSSVYGDLYVDEGLTQRTTGRYATLSHFGPGTVTALTADTLTLDGQVAVIPGGLVGLEIKPNRENPSTFVIVSNTANTVTVALKDGESLTDVAQVGDRYVGVDHYDNVYVRGGAGLTLGEELIVENRLVLSEQARITQYPVTLSYLPYVKISAGTIEVSLGADINVDGRGYLGGKQSGNGCEGRTTGNGLGSTYRAAGSYGGLGRAIEGMPNPIYGNANDPSDFGSGGSCGWADLYGGSGGGWIELAGQNLILDGSISAAGQNGGGYQSGSGSGGTINITMQSVSGSGSVSANGGAGEVAAGGGRVAVGATTLTLNPANITATAGSTGGAQDGSVYLH